MISEDSVPHKVKNILERRLEGETVVMSTDGEILYTFDGVARFIWERIDGTRSLDTILLELIGEYQIEDSIARTDLLEFIEKLSYASLVGI